MFVEDFFGYDNFSENMNCVNNIYSAQLKSSIVDQVSIRKNTNVDYSATKKTWQYDNVLLGDFINNLEAGNINNKGVPIISLIFMRKKTTDLMWEQIISIPYLNTQQLYSFIDKYVASNVSMDYALIPCSISEVQGDWILGTIIPSFSNTFIFDDVNNYHLDKNIKWESIATNISVGKYEPLGAIYPIKVYGSMKYKTGKVTSTLMVDDSIEQLGNGWAGINPEQERMQMDGLVDFLNNFSPKILKDGQGKMLCVSTENCIEIPNNELGGAISDISFDFTEIGETSIKTLDKMNLGNIIPD